MDSILTILGIIFFISFFYQVPMLLRKIANHLYRIRLLLEFQNPVYDAENLWQFDQVATYWEDVHEKYDNDYSEANKELRDLVFNRLLKQYRLGNLMRQYYFQSVKSKGDVDKVDEKFEDEIDKLNEEIKELEDKISSLNPKVKEQLDKKNLDMEFAGRWRYNED